jgi:hypothetical protein
VLCRNVLLLAMVGSMIISTLFALFWSEIFTDEAASLRYSATAVVFVWIYTLIWLAATVSAHPTHTHLSMLLFVFM